MEEIFINEHNYVRSEELALVSLESLAIVVTAGYSNWLALAKPASPSGLDPQGMAKGSLKQSC